MSNDYFDLESILQEYHAEAPAAPAPGKRAEKAPAKAETSIRQQRPASAPRRDAAPVQRPRTAADIQPERPIRSKPQPRPVNSAAPAESPVVRTRASVPQAEKPAPSRTRPVRMSQENHREDERNTAARRSGRSERGSTLRDKLSKISAAVTAALLLLVLLCAHPDSGSVAGSGTQRTDISKKLVSFVDASRLASFGTDTGAAPAAPGETETIAAIVGKHYTIDPDATVAPLPIPSAYGAVAPQNAAQIMDVIDQARQCGLLGEQEVLFNPEINFRSDTDIEYYFDETTLVIAWKELIDGTTCSCVEVKVADASQFRRKLVDDSFGSSVQMYASALSDSVNAVIAMNADFYMFRDFGIVVYNGHVYRCSDSTYTGSYKKYNCVDTLFIDDNGDFSFFHRLETASMEEVQQYVDANNINFSISFGPVLIEDGVVQNCDWYPAGEYDKGYSRAGICQLDTLHYFYMSANHSPERDAMWTVNDFAGHLAEKGIRTAYCLDGGQTSEIYFRDKMFNHVDYGAERLVSDIIYFATAIPDTEAKS